MAGLMPICASAATPSTKKGSVRSSRKSARRASAPEARWVNEGRGGRPMRARLKCLPFLLGVLAFATMREAGAQIASPDPGNWPSILDKARGQTVYWYAWGGSQPLNDYIP